MDPLQVSDHLVQNRQTGEQMTHCDMLNKATTKFEVSLFNMSQWVIYALQFGNFVPLDHSASKGPFQPLHQSIKMASKRAFVEKKTCKKKQLKKQQQKQKALSHVKCNNNNNNNNKNKILYHEYTLIIYLLLIYLFQQISTCVFIILFVTDQTWTAK